MPQWIMPHFDFTINVPTLIVIVGILIKGWNKLQGLLVQFETIKYQIDSMWTEFIKDHPEYRHSAHDIF